jgi:hypothetical protein
MHDFGRISRERRTRFAEFRLNKSEDLLQLRESLCSGGHQRVAACNRGDLGHPTRRLIAIEQHFVIVETHTSLYCPTSGCCMLVPADSVGAKPSSQY